MVPSRAQDPLHGGTLHTYSHVLPTMQDAATQKLESILFGKTGTQ